MSKKAYKSNKKYACPYCDVKLNRMDLITHVESKHEALIPANYSATRVVYESINKTDHGTCMICKKPVYEWNEKISRYNNLCGSDKCRAEVRRIALERHIKTYNTPTLLNDPEHQEKMLANRKISGRYNHSDGGKFTYTGKYEKAAIEFMDKVMNIPSKDIQMPGPILEYNFRGEKHKWITDIYYIPGNLIIEVKDGGDNPNNRNMPDYRAKQVAKEEMVTELGTFNYLRLTNNNFAQLLEVLAEIKYENIDQSEAPKVVLNINESTRLRLLKEDKSELDKNFKPKKVIELSSLKRVHITESVIEKYKKEYPVLRHVRCKDTKDYICDGYMWFDGNNLVCYVGSCEYTDDHTKWIVSLEITPEYKGHGLSKQIVDFAVKSMGCKYLSVDKNNKIAKHVYDRYGFKTYQDDDHMNYMTIDYKAIANESAIITEKVFRSIEDIYWNKDKFDSGEINLCFITGLSGSGKSTMGRDMQKDGIEHYELDDVCTNWNFSDDNLKEYGDLISSFFKGPGKKYRYHSTEEFLDDKEWDGKDGKDNGYEACVIRDFIKYAMSYAKSHKDTKFVLEGVWMFLFFEPSYFKDYAFYIKGTSMILSNIRGAKRDVGNQIDKDEHPFKYKARLIVDINQHWLYYIKDELKIRNFVNYYSKLVRNKINEEVGGLPLHKPNRPVIIPCMMSNTFTVGITDEELDDVFIKDETGTFNKMPYPEFIKGQPNDGVMLIMNNPCISIYEAAEKSPSSILEFISILAGRRLRSLDELYLDNSLSKYDRSMNECSSVVFRLRGLFTENEISSGSCKRIGIDRIIKGAVMLGQSEKGYYIYTPNDYSLSSNYYESPEAIPQNIIDTMADLYDQHKKREEITNE